MYALHCSPDTDKDTSSDSGSKAAPFLLSSRASYYFTNKYLSSLSRLPAAILSVTHSGLTTKGFVPLLVVSNLCVLFPLKCWDVTIWVALDADRLRLCNIRSAGCQRHMISHEQCLPACVCDDPLHFDICRVSQIPVDVDPGIVQHP
jgi:hypothetical protein